MSIFSGSRASNYTDILTKTTQNISTDLVNKSINSTAQSQIISIVDNEADEIIISGNEFRNTARVDAKSYFKNLVSNEARQKILQQTTQKAKAVTSGIQFGSMSSSTNYTKQVAEALMNISTNISNLCNTSIVQEQGIEIARNRVTKAIRIIDNKFEQKADLAGECIADNVVNNVTIQDVAQKVKQTAIAESKGISFAELIIVFIIIAVGFLLISGGPIFAARKLITPTIIGGIIAIGCIIAGGILLAIYLAPVEPDISTFAFSKRATNVPACKASEPYTPVAPSGGFPTPQSAMEACLKDTECEGAEWIAKTQTTPQSVLFYKKFGNKGMDCMENLVDTGDNSPPKLYAQSPVMRTTDKTIASEIASGLPADIKNGDMYVNTNNGSLFVVRRVPNTGTYEVLPAAQGNLRTIVEEPEQGQPTAIHVKGPGEWGGEGCFNTKGYIIHWGIPNSDSTMPIYYIDNNITTDGGCFTRASDRTGNDAFIDSFTYDQPEDKDINWTGIKVAPKNTPFLAIGGALIGIGIILLIVLIVAYVKGKKRPDTISEGGLLNNIKSFFFGKKVLAPGTPIEASEGLELTVSEPEATELLESSRSSTKLLEAKK